MASAALRQTLFLASALLLSCFVVFALVPLTSPLPAYTGPHGVGVLDVEVAVEEPRVVDAHGDDDGEGSGDLRLKADGSRAFELETLSVTLYYPTAARNARRHGARMWLPQPVALVGAGYARIAHVPALSGLFTLLLWVFGSRVVIPGVENAAVVDAIPRMDDGSRGVQGIFAVQDTVQKVLKDVGVAAGAGEKLPCVVFTHGMAGMSQSYSHYLGSIASHGYVVAAIEHRDGSGPGTIVHAPDTAAERRVWHLEAKDVVSDSDVNPRALQIAQLAFREAEIEETVRLFQRLDSADDNAAVTVTTTTKLQNLKPNSPRPILNDLFPSRLNLSAITLIGHSYGATGALQAVRPNTTAEKKKQQLNGAIALDPGKGSGPLNAAIDVPLLVLHSGAWTDRQTQFYGLGWHFDVVRKLVAGAGTTGAAWFMTLAGSAHPSITDAPLIVPRIMRAATGTTLDATVALREYIDVSVAFLDFLRTGARTGMLGAPVTSPEGPLGDVARRGTRTGESGGEWEVHVVPSAEAAEGS